MVLYERPSERRTRQWIIDNAHRLTKDELQAALKQLEDDIAKIREHIASLPDRF
jgi:hypothetical protein